jgi:hypothetical protein
MSMQMAIRMMALLALFGSVAMMPAAQGQGIENRNRKDTIEPFILSSVEVVRGNIYDTSNGSLPMYKSVMNDLHTVTRERVIRYEIFPEPGDTITQSVLDQIESNMRQLGIFASISFQVITPPEEEVYLYPESTLRVITRDNWSTRFGLVYSSGGNAQLYGVTVREVNLFGRAKQLSLGADYSTVNDRGWGFGGSFFDPNFYGTHLQIGGSLGISRLEKSTAITLGRPFYADNVPSAFGSAVTAYDGTEFFYAHRTGGTIAFGPHTHATDLSAWYGHSALGAKKDLFRWSARVTYDHTRRDTSAAIPTLRRAFENSAGLYGGVFSLRRTYSRFQNAEFTGEALVPLGGMGSVSLGYYGPVSNGVDEGVYIGAEARQGVQIDNLYLYGRIQAGTALANRSAKFTLERFVGSALLQVAPGAFAFRVEQTNIWNWPRYVFQPLDNLVGLRGYDLFQLFGDNKLVFNTEYRLLPGFNIIGFNLGAVAFYDVGAVWNQSQKLPDTRFHSSAGIGIRVSGGGDGKIDQGLFRVDLAYNFDQKRLAQIIFSTQEAFDVFGSLDYQPPGPYVP